MVAVVDKQSDTFETRGCLAEKGDAGTEPAKYDLFSGGAIEFGKRTDVAREGKSTWTGGEEVRKVLISPMTLLERDAFICWAAQSTSRGVDLKPSRTKAGASSR